MASYRLSAEADLDVDGILEFTRQKWGLAQAIRYSTGLIATLNRLAEKPHTGKTFSESRPDLLHSRYGQHQIFYLKIDDGIFVVRVLHSRMDFLRHI